jgi:NodT family efflux transporter outer membrane factor (OMF) lipoprotein
MKRAIVCCSFAAIAALVSGCAVGPNYHRPDVPSSAAFKEAPPAGWKEAQPNEAIPRGHWWEIYNDPQLNALEEQVTISNQNVIAAMARFQEARDQIRIARSSLFPTVTASPSITVVHTAKTAALSGVISTGSATVVDYQMPVNFSYQADIWGGIRRGVNAATATAQASAADLENARLTYQSQLAEMYFEMHGLDGDADLLTRTVALYEQSLKLTQDRFELGVVSGADVAQAQTQLATTRAQLVDLGVARAQYEHAIAVLVGKAPADITISSQVLTVPPPAIPIGLPSALMERRPDITMQERTVAAANEQIGVATAALYPVLSLVASGGFESTSLAQWFTLPSRFWSVGPQLAATLFDAGKHRAQIRLTEAQYDEAVANYRQTVLTAFQQVEDQLAGLRILEQETEAEREAVQAAQEALDIATAQYTAGTTDYLQVITTQTAALQAQKSLVDVLTRRLTASVLLVEALGGGWDVSQLPSP